MGIDPLGEDRISSMLQANTGYWQVIFDEPNREKTTFTSLHGLYNFVLMLFGLQSAPVPVQRAIGAILSSVKSQPTLFFLEDIVFLSKTVKKHFIRFQRLWMLLQATGVVCKLKKFSFFVETINYFGIVIRHGKLEKAESATDAIRQLQDPATQTEIRLFLELQKVFGRFSATSRMWWRREARRLVRTNQSRSRR